MSLISCLIMESFSLVFLYLWVIFEFVCLKFWKMSFSFFLVIFILVLNIVNCRFMCVFVCFISRVLMLMVFWLVNLMVLLSRLVKIWFRWVGLLISWWFICLLRFRLMFIGLFFILSWKFCLRLFRIWWRLKGFDLRLSWLVLILERFSILLIRDSRLFVENLSEFR